MLQTHRTACSAPEIGEKQREKTFWSQWDKPAHDPVELCLLATGMMLSLWVPVLIFMQRLLKYTG